jgi:hypothetical protein
MAAERPKVSRQRPWGENLKEGGVAPAAVGRMLVWQGRSRRHNQRIEARKRDARSLAGRKDARK